MKLKKKIVAVSAAVLVLTAVIAFTALGAGTYGSQSDPLVTKSYLDDTLTPNLIASFKSALEQRIRELGGNVSGSAAADQFTVVTMTNGQIMTCQVGTEIMLRIGSAESYGPDSPRLVDETDGSAVSDSAKALSQNHMYLVTIEGNGIKSTGSTKVLVRGSYSLS